MSLQLTKEHLIELLIDRDNKVIALSGKWGTGKSYLWAEIQNNAADEKIKGAIYASLFGLSSIDQIKRKLIEMALPGVESNPNFWASAKQAVTSSVKVLEGFHSSFSALNDLSLILAPRMLKEKVIVLDDIERKHANLHSDEVMGFIDEFSQQHGVRFILILNNNQLADRALWDTLREKVIDQELLLETTPAEAFEIAKRKVTTHYAEKIKNIIEICEVSNIRIICKVIKAVNQILSNRTDLSEEVLSRVVPSTVLLAATHYKGLENGPNFEFILKIGTTEDYWGDFKEKGEPLSDAEKQRAGWRLFLQRLGIYRCDEYEEIVVSFLKSGLFDTSNVDKVIDRYANEADTMQANALTGMLYHYVYWHPKMTEAELINKAKQVIKQSHLLDLYSVTDIHKLISDLPSGEILADSMIDDWILASEAKLVENFEYENHFNRPIHPKIQAAFDSAKNQSFKKYSLFDACKHIVEQHGWGEKQEATMRAATTQDFEATIRELEGEHLRLFMLKFMELCLNAENFSKHFGDATKNFIAACQNICNSQTDDRLGTIIQSLFESSKIESFLIHKP